MNRTVYQTNTEDSLLQSLGPHRIQITTEPLEGVIVPETTVVGQSLVFGETETYGTRIEPNAQQERKE